METPINSNFKADSLKLRVPIEELKKGLFERSALNKVSRSYIINEFNEVDYYITNDGEFKTYNEVPHSEKIINSIELSNDNGVTKLPIFIESTRIDGVELRECISMPISSKPLKEKYFGGINENIDVIADYIKTATDSNGNSYEIPIETLLNGYVTDLDICRDYEMNRNDFRSFINKVKLIAKSSPTYTKGYFPFDRADNQGIVFSNRATATPTNPFLKYYNKRIEMLSALHSYFFETYFNFDDDNTPNIVRAEFTLKNKQHFKHHKLEGTQLKDVVGISQERWQSIYNKILSNHFTKQTRTPYNTGKYDLLTNWCLFVDDSLEKKITVTKENRIELISEYANIGASQRTRFNNLKKVKSAIDFIDKNIISAPLQTDLFASILDF